jgi:hypothetical protein
MKPLNQYIPKREAKALRKKIKVVVNEEEKEYVRSQTIINTTI